MFNLQENIVGSTVFLICYEIFYATKSLKTMNRCYCSLAYMSSLGRVYWPESTVFGWVGWFSFSPVLLEKNDGCVED